MKYAFKQFFCSTLFLLAFCVFAQNDGTANSAESKTEKPKLILTVDEAVKRALETHVDIQRSAIKLEQSKREYSHSWNKVLPSVSVTGSVAEKQVWKDSDSDALNATVGASASLSLNTGIASAIKALKSSYEAGKISFDDTVRSTETAVRKSFYRLLYLQQSLETSRSTLDSYQKQYNQTRNKFSRGVVPELDLLTAQVNLETARPDVDSALASFNNGLHEFLDTIGIEPGTEVELSGSLDDADLVLPADYSLLDDCIEKSASVKKLEQDLKTARYTKSAKFNSLFFPSLNLSASVNPEVYTYNKITSKSSETPDWSVSVGISIPIDSWIPGSSSRDAVASLDDTIKDYEVQLENLKKTVRTSTAQKLDDIALSQKTLEARRMNVELAKKSYAMTEEAYQRGTKDLLTLQTSLDKLRSAELQLRSEQYNLLSNVLELENTLSVPSGTFMKKEN
ncbi:MAG: TolC family protein [Treponema sp.]